MTMRTIILIVLAASLAACGKETKTAAPSAGYEEAPAAAKEPAPAAVAENNGFAGKVWTATTPGSPPGSMRIFLDSGALVQTSCFETYRLSGWRQINDGRIAWSEDGAEIEAEIVAGDSDHLTLKLQLGAEEKVETYRLAEIPYVCPDMPR